MVSPPQTETETFVLTFVLQWKQIHLAVRVSVRKCDIMEVMIVVNVIFTLHCLSFIAGTFERDDKNKKIKK